jgi:hypothetical protein
MPYHFAARIGRPADKPGKHRLVSARPFDAREMHAVTGNDSHYLTLGETYWLAVAKNPGLYREAFLGELARRLAAAKLRAFARHSWFASPVAIPAPAWFIYKPTFQGEGVAIWDYPGGQCLILPLPGAHPPTFSLGDCSHWRAEHNPLRLRFLSAEIESVWIKKPRESAERGAIKECCNKLEPGKVLAFKAMNKAERDREFRTLLPDRYKNIDRKTLLAGLDEVLNITL